MASGNAYPGNYHNHDENPSFSPDITKESTIPPLGKQADAYHVEQKESAGLLPSKVFPGLILDVKALLKLDKAKVIQGLKGGRKKR